MADRVGQQLGNYQLIRLLGEGGFAEVYLGEHIHLGTQAAIKVLHTQLTSDDVDKFRFEARTIARLIHPHIVRVLEFGVEGKTPFLVMDYAPNGTLRQRHPKGVALPLPLIVAYVKQVADALQYAHDEKLIHRDIKPENILIGRRNEILLSDFGIALVAQSSRYQSAQEMAGTMAYMAPEQIQGKPRPASDQYSLGIVVYEWLSGDRPFHGSLTELVGQHLSVPPPPLQEKVPTIPPIIEQVVLTALAKDPKKRFANVQEFATALGQTFQIVPSPPIVLPSKSASPSQTLLANDMIAVILPNQLPQTMNVVTPPSQSSQALNMVDSLNQLSQPPIAAMPSSASPSAKTLSNAQPEEFLSVTNSGEVEKTAPILRPRRGTTLMSHRQALPKSRRVVLIGLVLLVIASSIGLFSLSIANRIATDNAHLKATATTHAAASTAANASATDYAVTAIAQANATATIVAQITATAIALKNIFSRTPTFQDSLSDNTNYWCYYGVAADCNFSGGVFHLIDPGATGPSSALAYPLNANLDFYNFAYTVDMKVIKGFGGGIIFRVKNDGVSYNPVKFYYFLVGTDGSYSLQTRDALNNSFQTLQAGFKSAIRTGLNQSNLLTVVAHGSNFDLYVNQQIVLSANDSTFSDGSIGVFAFDSGHPNNEANPPVEVIFSKARVWKL